MSVVITRSARSSNSRARISSDATKPKCDSDEGRRSSTIRRFNAIPLFNVVVRWINRSVASGCVDPRRDLSRATSSFAAVSSAPNSSCNSRARWPRSSSRTFCRWVASSPRLAVRSRTCKSSWSRSRLSESFSRTPAFSSAFVCSRYM